MHKIKSGFFFRKHSSRELSQEVPIDPKKEVSKDFRGASGGCSTKFQEFCRWFNGITRIPGAFNSITGVSEMFQGVYRAIQGTSEAFEGRFKTFQSHFSEF